MGAFMDIIGGIQEGNILNASAKAQASADFANAQIAKQNAKITEEQTAAAVAKQDRERRLRLGANIAGAGASGTGLSSSMDVLQDNAAQEALDILTLKYEGNIKKTDYLNQSNILIASGLNTKAQGAAAKSAAIFKGISKAADKASQGMTGGTA